MERRPQMFEIHTVRDRVEGVGRVGGGYAQKVHVGWCTVGRGDMVT